MFQFSFLQSTIVIVLVLSCSLNSKDICWAGTSLLEPVCPNSWWHLKEIGCRLLWWLFNPIQTQQGARAQKSDQSTWRTPQWPTGKSHLKMWLWFCDRPVLGCFILVSVLMICRINVFLFFLFWDISIWTMFSAVLWGWLNKLLR